MKGETEVQIDWSQAPAKATHCHAPSGEWLRVEGSRVSVWQPSVGLWHTRVVEEPRLTEDEGFYQRAVPWNGEGLPPVGTICFYQAGSRKAQKVHILAHAKHGNRDAVLMAKDQMGPGKMIGRIVNPENFAPILTPEEKVAREINDIQAVLKGADDDLDCAQRLVAAGYRKVEGGAQ